MRDKTWLAMYEDESEQHELVACAYNDTGTHHPLHWPQLQHTCNVGAHCIPDMHTIDGYDPETHMA